jgi:large conductance mechanosensitive channel
MIKKETSLKKMDKKKIIKKVVGQKDEFFDFIKDYNVIQLAIGVVLGNSAKSLVNAIVSDLIMPIISVVTPGGSWEQRIVTIGPTQFNIGNLLSNVLDFFIVALVVYILVKKIFRINLEKK